MAVPIIWGSLSCGCPCDKSPTISGLHYIGSPDFGRLASFASYACCSFGGGPWWAKVYSHSLTDDLLDSFAREATDENKHPFCLGPFWGCLLFFVDGTQSILPGSLGVLVVKRLWEVRAARITPTS